MYRNIELFQIHPNVSKKRQAHEPKLKTKQKRNFKNNVSSKENAVFREDLLFSFVIDLKLMVNKLTVICFSPDDAIYNKNVFKK